MNPQNRLTFQNQFAINMDQKEYEVSFWDITTQCCQKTKIGIQITNDNQINYIRDGVILRIDQFLDSSENSEIFTNIEQIQNFQWQGKQELNKKKTGRWKVIWQGVLLQKVGGYYKFKNKYYIIY